MNVTGILLSYNATLGMIHTFRHYFLFPAKWGKEEGCAKLQEKVDALREKMKVSIPIKVAVNPWMSWSAHGAAIYGKGAITVPPSEIDPNEKLSDDVQTALLAHEIAHIKYNDGPWPFLITIVVFTVSSFFLWHVLPIEIAHYGFLFSLIPSISEMFRQMVLQERQADTKACKALSIDQKKAFLNWLERQWIEMRNYRNDPRVYTITSIWRKTWYDPGGNFVLKRLSHPTWKERIYLVRSQIKAEERVEPQIKQPRWLSWIILNERFFAQKS